MGIPNKAYTTHRTLPRRVTGVKSPYPGERKQADTNALKADFNREIREFKTRVYGKRQTANGRSKHLTMISPHLPFTVCCS